MTTETNENFDNDLHTLFAPIHPVAGFEDRLVSALHDHRRWSLPAPIYKAAIAATAVLVVGSTGYFGNRVIFGFGSIAKSCATNLHQIGQAVLLYSADDPNWNFGGGSNPAQKWVDRNGNKFAADGWKLKNPDTTYAVSSDLNNAPVPPAAKPFANFGNSLSQRGGQGGGSSNNIFLPQAEKSVRSRTPNTLYFRASPVARNPTRSVEQESKALRSFDGKSNYDSVADSNVGNKTAPDGWMKNPFVGTQHDNDAPSSAVAGGLQTDKTANVPYPDMDSILMPQTNDSPGPYTPPNTPVSATTQPADDRKIIRTGSMEFDVDRFDAAQTQIIKIVTELGGFVGATDSQKLPNGKVRGSITVRVAPERLDTLIMSLRALGDLKNQQISAMDVTKEYTDLQSELIADHAMQDRLLELIHNGKGSVKDLLAAENELGNWRGKIEKAEGAIRYYNAQVTLSTLTITLSERDIQTPATAIETETADVGLEAEDVEKTRNSAISLIEQAKGRIIEAELKRYDAGQLAGKLVADVPPESAGAILDQLKLLGTVARLEIHRQQANGDQTPTAITPLKTDRKPTRLLISIYNLANIAPRHITDVNLAAEDVEAAYAALTDIIKTNGGRVVQSNLDRGDPVKATGSLMLEIPPDKFETAMSAIHARGDVLKLTSIENPDVQNSTEAKQGLTVTLVSLASVPPREKLQQSIAAADVSAAYQSILTAANIAHALVQSAQLNEQDRQNITADLQLEVPRAKLESLEKALTTAGATIAQNSTRAPQADGTVDSKLALKLSITSSDHLPPRETTHLKIEVADVEKSATDIQAAAIAAGGRVLESTATNDHGKGTARIALDLPLGKTADVLQQLRSAGTVAGIDSSRDPQAPAGPMAHGQIFVEFNTTQALVADQFSPLASIRQGVSTSITGLMWSLQWVVVGLCLISPWALIGWFCSKLWHRRSDVAATRIKPNIEH